MNRSHMRMRRGVFNRTAYFIKFSRHMCTRVKCYSLMLTPFFMLFYLPSSKCTQTTYPAHNSNKHISPSVCTPNTPLSARVSDDRYANQRTRTSPTAPTQNSWPCSCTRACALITRKIYDVVNGNLSFTLTRQTHTAPLLRTFCVPESAWKAHTHTNLVRSHRF